MDPATVVVMLSTHLMASGGLFYLISRRMADAGGLRRWASGALLFGLAYLVRIAFGTRFGGPAALIADCTMVLAAALLLGGTLQWVGQTTVRARTLVATVVTYALAHLVAVHTLADVGRHLLLNLSLGVVYVVASGACFRAMVGQAGSVRAALLSLATLMGCLGLATLARGLYILPAGIGPLFSGWTAQAYYGLSSLFVLLMAMNLVWMVFVRLNTQLHALALHDPLTGALNRNGLDDHLARHFADRRAGPIVLLVIDADHFKRINDSHGHATGDLVLRAIAHSVASKVRSADRVARVGGEEFVVCCADGDLVVATALAERVRSGVESAHVPVGPSAGLPACTVSIGVSQPLRHLAGRDVAMQQADAALYAAKAAGRNRVVVYQPPGEGQGSP